MVLDIYQGLGKMFFHGQRSGIFIMIENCIKQTAMLCY